jgi:hypothetical protein
MQQLLCLIPSKPVVAACPRGIYIQEFCVSFKELILCPLRLSEQKIKLPKKHLNRLVFIMEKGSIMYKVETEFSYKI